MNGAQRKSLQAAGWTIGDAATFLELTANERHLLDVRVKLALAERRQREAREIAPKGLVQPKPKRRQTE